MRKLQQRSVAELIDQYLEDGLGAEEICCLFRNSVLVHALSRTQGNVTAVSILLKIHRNSVQRWMNEFHIRKEAFYDSDLESENDSPSEIGLVAGRSAESSPTENRSGTRTGKETQPRQERA